jgi:hypothetical protein
LTVQPEVVKLGVGIAEARMRNFGIAILVALGAISASQGAVAQPPAVATQAPVIVTKPEWVRQPSYLQVAVAYPAGARIDGQGSIACLVNTVGVLHDCKVLDEKPLLSGFGQSVRLLSTQFIMKPVMKDGRAVEAKVALTMTFKAHGDRGHLYDYPFTYVLSDVAWLKTPTVSDILAELDRKVGGKFADPEGAILVQCALDHDSGKVTRCDVVNETPGMAPFSEVARDLAATFQANPADLTVYKQLRYNTRVNLVFRFPDMRSQGFVQRRLLNRWKATPGAQQLAFPADALKAGLTAGSAVVDCLAASDGTVHQCEVVRESPPGTGFGQAALEGARFMATNPWADGTPVEGGHARFTFNFRRAPGPAPAAAAPLGSAAPAPTPSTKP